MGINTAINNFENDLVNLINGYEIPITCKKYVLLCVLAKVEKAVDKSIEQEAAEEATKAENQEEKENE